MQRETLVWISLALIAARQRPRSEQEASHGSPCFCLPSRSPARPMTGVGGWWWKQPADI